MGFGHEIKVEFFSKSTVFQAYLQKIAVNAVITVSVTSHIPGTNRKNKEAARPCWRQSLAPDLCKLFCTESYTF
jgi:hypothetical protein